MPVTLPPISRRRFLGRAVATAAAAALAACPRDLLAGPATTAAAPPLAVDANRIALFSDTHLNADKLALHKTGVSMWDHFARAADEVLALPVRPAAVLVNGDVAHLSGRPADYVTVIEGLRPLRAAGLPVHLGLGNHDHRANLLAAVPSDERHRVAALPQRSVSVVRTPTADWYVLDSLAQTNLTPGELGAEQLAWLGQRLDADPTRPAVILMHHQPDREPPITGLTDTAPFLDLVLPRQQVKAVLFGHTHVWRNYEREALHFINLPATAYVFNPKQPSGWVDATTTTNTMKLELRALTPDHPLDKQVLNLKWR